MKYYNEDKLLIEDEEEYEGPYYQDQDDEIDLQLEIADALLSGVSRSPKLMQLQRRLEREFHNEFLRVVNEIKDEYQDFNEYAVFDQMREMMVEEGSPTIFSILFLEELENIIEG
jgi:hypothetical protein